MARKPVDLAADERAELAELLASLPADEWERPTALPGWSVRDIAAHVISYEPLGWPGFLLLFGRARFSLERANAIGLDRAAQLGPEDILAQYRAFPRPVVLTSSFGGRLGLTDTLIHHQDIRRALGRSRTVPADPLRAAISFSFWALPLPARRLAKGLRLVATDLDRQWGSGPEVRGPGEALLMALAGRDALADLDGPGVPVLTSRGR
ncbi:MAG: maleylpyruvate isomerase family mycothiol-dependent enzyme [Tetrasphaera sp.]